MNAQYLLLATVAFYEQFQTVLIAGKRALALELMTFLVALEPLHPSGILLRVALWGWEWYH